MSFNGAGTFVINSTGQPVVTGTTISSVMMNALTADLATGLSTCVTKDGQTTTTALVPFTAGISLAGINQANKRASVYQYTAWDPTDVAGTQTNASSTAAATSTATDYVTAANSSGTVTFTNVKAGQYRFTVSGVNEAAAAFTALQLDVVVAGTATILFGTPSVLKIQRFENGGAAPVSDSFTFYAVMTAGQTVTFLPKLSVTSAGVTTNFTQQCTVSAEYTGTS